MSGDRAGRGDRGLSWGVLTSCPTPCRKSPVAVKKEEEKKPHIKKPLNAFMLYMKEMRAKVVAECTLKESAAINQILGRRVRWGSPIRDPSDPLASLLPLDQTPGLGH